MRLVDVAARVDLVVHDGHDAAALRGRVGGDGDGVVEVQRAVRALRGGGAHRADEDDGLVALQDEAEEEPRLLERVRPVRHDDAVHVGLREELVRAPGELAPHDVVHVLAADGGDLLAVELRELLDARGALDEGVDREAAGLVAGLAFLRLDAGDRAAGREDHDVREGGLGGGGGGGLREGARRREKRDEEDERERDDAFR